MKLTLFSTMKTLIVLFLLCPFYIISQSEQIVAPDSMANGDTLSFQKDTSKIVRFVSYQEASFRGGMAEMNKYIKDNFQYPNSSISDSPQGRAFIEITVDSDGSIKDVKVLKGISEELDEELLRVVKNMPNWIPTDSKDGKVKSLVRFPVNFRSY